MFWLLLHACDVLVHAFYVDLMQQAWELLVVNIKTQIKGADIGKCKKDYLL